LRSTPGTMADLSPETLHHLQRQAFDEYRAEVALAWDRQKAFFTLNLAVAGLAASLVQLSRASHGWAPAGLLLLDVCVALLGVVVVAAGHRRYRRTRAALKAFEKRLGVPPDLALQTTAGMAGEARPPLHIRVTAASRWILALFAVAEAAAAVYLLGFWRGTGG
jgi:uncharacterized membrane protein YidH (DUF202 family)